MTCLYCKSRMLEVVLGWHCPQCHATVGHELTAKR
jgi:hypothetical protein